MELITTITKVEEVLTKTHSLWFCVRTYGSQKFGVSQCILDYLTVFQSRASWWFVVIDLMASLVGLVFCSLSKITPFCKSLQISMGDRRLHRYFLQSSDWELWSIDQGLPMQALIQLDIHYPDKMQMACRCCFCSRIWTSNLTWHICLPKELRLHYSYPTR